MWRGFWPGRVLPGSAARTMAGAAADAAAIRPVRVKKRRRFKDMDWKLEAARQFANPEAVPTTRKPLGTTFRFDPRFDSRSIRPCST